MKCSVIRTKKGSQFFYELIGTKGLRFFSSVYKQVVFCRFYQNRYVSRSSLFFSGTGKKKQLTRLVVAFSPKRGRERWYLFVCTVRFFGSVTNLQLIVAISPRRGQAFIHAINKGDPPNLVS